MKTKLLLLPLLTLASLGAELPATPEKVKQEHGYASFGLGPAPIPLPIFGLGYRMQNNHDGADFFFQASSLICSTVLKANAYYLHFFKPSYTERDSRIGFWRLVHRAGTCFWKTISQ